MPGTAIQIINTSEEHTFLLNEDALSEVLMRDEVKDRFVCVVSVAGAFRKGKSFLLDFFLRYLYSKVISKKSHYFVLIIFNPLFLTFSFLCVVCAP